MSKRAKQFGHKCGMTGKICFNSHSHAMNRIQELMAQPDFQAKQLSAYSCQFCGAWHFTSK